MRLVTDELQMRFSTNMMIFCTLLLDQILLREVEDNLFELIYQSRATEDISECELLDLLAKYRKANIQHDITGFLLYHNRTFIQVLEGPRCSVEQLYQNISSDELNTNVKLLWKSEIAERGFGEWTMAFAHMTQDSRDCPALSNFLNDGEIDGDLKSVVTTSKSLFKSMASEFTGAL